MKRHLIAMIILSVSAPSWALLPGNTANGRALHDSRCVSCHTAKFGGDGSGIYTRADRKVKTVEGLMKQVEICNQMTKAGLSEGQQNDLVKYLSEQYYKFP